MNRSAQIPSSSMGVEKGSRPHKGFADNGVVRRSQIAEKDARRQGAIPHHIQEKASAVESHGMALTCASPLSAPDAPRSQGDAPQTAATPCEAP